MLITIPCGDTSGANGAGSIQESLLMKEGSSSESLVDEEEERRLAAEAADLPQKSMGQMLSTLNCWLLWIGVAYAIPSHAIQKSTIALSFLRLIACDSRALSGGGQLVSANVNQMCESLGYGRPAVAVSLFAVGNGLGRILAGSLSEVIHQTRLAPRPFNLLVATAVMASAHFLFWLDLGEQGLYIAVFLAAFSFGATWPLTVVVTSELWGTKHHGANYLVFDGSTTGIATPFLAKWVAQTYYTRHIHGDCPVRH